MCVCLSLYVCACVCVASKAFEGCVTKPLDTFCSCKPHFLCQSGQLTFFGLHDSGRSEFQEDGDMQAERKDEILKKNKKQCYML